MAQELSSEERAQIAGELLSGLEYPGRSVSTEAADEAWKQEAHRRAGRVLRGQTEGISAEDVHSEIDAELTRRG
jgi:putative addiction module component (TIGR02574 family)